jgi:hypothetical protein
MKEYTLTRSGTSQIVFTGEELAQAHGHQVGSRERTRYYIFTLYRTAGDLNTLILSVQYRTRWDGEQDVDEVYTFHKAQEIGPFLQRYNRLANVKGYPARETFRERQDELEKEIILDFDALVSELLSRLPDSAEKIR